MKQQIIDSLRQIPFMDLKIDFDFKKIQSEVLKNETWHNYHPPLMELTTELAELHRSYKQCALTTIHKQGNSSIVREQFLRWKNKEKNETENYYTWPLEDQRWYPTEIIDLFPFLSNLITSLTDKPILSKIVKSGPGHLLGWHSHQNDDLMNFKAQEQCIIHIPIVTNPNVVHIVTKEIHEDRRQMNDIDFYKSDCRYHIENFSAGKIWFFNSYHQHTYKNFSDVERIDVLIFNDIRENPTLEKIIKRAIKSYKGPFIK